MNTIPFLDEQAIRTFVGEQNFLKGQQYAHNGAIVDPRRQGITLKAYCYGSLPEPYRVQVTFDGTGISSALCSCPAGTSIYGNRGCKHVAALLLTWHEKPELFTESDDLDTILERRDKAELITLIKQLLAKQPEIEWQLTMPTLPHYKPKVSIDTQEYSRQVDEAFRHGGHEWNAVYGISSDLYNITSIASRFAKQEDYANAAAVYTVVAIGTLGYYHSYHDEDGALGRVVKYCIEALGDCLEGEREDQAVRQNMIETIFAVYRSDVDGGGYGLTDEIPPQLLQQTTPEEKRTIAEWVRTAIAETLGTDSSAEWHRKRYGGLLLALEAETLSDEEFLRIGRETKRIHEVVNRLLERGRIDEAARDAQQAEDRDLVKLADLFVQHGQDDVILPIMHERFKQTHRLYFVPQWLKNYYLARNDTIGALEVTERIFRKQPRLEGYQEMRELATQLGTWETKRQALLTFLETTKATYTLVEVALDEGNLDRALELLKVVTSPDQSQNHQWTYNYSLGYDITLRTAELVEETQPRASIDIYQQHVEGLIAQRGRKSYKAACSYLAKIRTLYEKLGEAEQWTNYIALLRKQNSGLATLKQELAAAGL